MCEDLATERDVHTAVEWPRYRGCGRPVQKFSVVEAGMMFVIFYIDICCHGMTMHEARLPSHTWVYSVPASSASSTLAFLRAGPAAAATAAEAAPPVLVRS
jgi:hypothetical protein